MKKKLATVVVSVACVCLAVSVLSSCGKGGNGGVTTIKFASWATRGDATTSEDYISLFEKKYPSIKVDYIAVTEGNYSEKLNAMIAAGTAPDVILAWECDIGRFAKSKAIIPLDDYVKKTTAFKADDFVPALKQLGSVTGATYGLPWCLAAEIGYYNKDLFDKAHVPYPKDDWTWQDFVDTAKKLTVVKDGKTTQWGCDALSFQGLWYSTIGATGENIIDDKGNLVLGEGAKTALQWQYDLTNKYKVCPPPSPSGTNAVDLFSAGKAAMTRTGNWMIGTYKGIKDFKWDIVPLPRKDRSYTTLHTGLYTINAKSKVKDAAWTFIEFALSDEGQAQIGKNSSNPSARPSVTAKGYYRSGGESGPTNWGALDASVAGGQFGYVMASPGVTNKAVSDFNAAMLGQMKIEDAVNDANAESKRAAQ